MLFTRECGKSSFETGIDIRVCGIQSNRNIHHPTGNPTDNPTVLALIDHNIQLIHFFKKIVSHLVVNAEVSVIQILPHFCVVKTIG